MKTAADFRRIYRDGEILRTKIDVHARYSSRPIDLHGAVATAIGAPGAADVLDVGCGTGHHLERLAMDGHTGRMVGVDLVVPDVALVGVRLVRGDARRLPFPAGAFDAVTCLHALSHIEIAPAMTEARRALRPGGTFVATANSMASYPATAEYRRRLHELNGWPEPRFTTSHVNAENLDATLRSYWTEVTNRTLTGELRIPRSAYLAYFAAHIPTWDRELDDHETANALQLVARWVADEHGDHVVEPKSVGLAVCTNPP